MNNKGTNDIFGKVFLIVIGAIVGYLCFVVMQYYNEWFALPFFILDVVIVLVALYAIRGMYAKRMYSFITDAVSNVRKITDGEELDMPADGVHLHEVTELYTMLDTLNKSLIAQNKYRDNVLWIINSIALNIELEKLLDDMLPKIIEGTGSNWGAFYLYNQQTEKMELKSSQGFTKNVYKEFDIALGEGFVGNAAVTDEIKIYSDIPDDTVYISRTFLGKIKPRSVMTVPIRSEGEAAAILLLASIYDYNEEQLETVKLIRYYMGTAVTNGVTYEKTKRLKNELLFQNQLIQNMNEELENKVEERTEFLNGVLNSILNYAVVSMDKDGYIRMWNKGAETLRGLSEKDVIGKHISEIYDEEKDEPLKRLNVAKKEGKYEDFGWHTVNNGKRLYMQRIVTSVYNEQGIHTGYTTIMKDMTDYKFLEDKAEYLGKVCGLLLGMEQGLDAVLDTAGIILSIGAEAAEICSLSAYEIIGKPLGDLFENDSFFKERLDSCLNNQATEIWTDRIKTENGIFLVNICLESIQADFLPKKIVTANITIINRGGKSELNSAL